MQVPPFFGRDSPPSPNAATVAPDPVASCAAVFAAIYPIGAAAGGAAPHSIWFRCMGSSVSCMFRPGGLHGAICLFAIEIAGHGCIPGDCGADRALRFVLKRVLPRSCRCSSQRHGAGPGAVLVRDRGFGYVFYGDHGPVAVYPGIGSGGPGRFPWASGCHGPRTPSGALAPWARPVLTGFYIIFRRCA